MCLHRDLFYLVSFRFISFCFVLSCLVLLKATRHSDFYFVITEWVYWLHLLQATYCVTEVREKIYLCLRLSTGMAQCSCSSQVYCVTLPSVHKHTCASWTRSCKLLLLLNKQKLWNCFIGASVTQKCIPLPNCPSHHNAKWKAFKNLLSHETHLLCFYLFIYLIWGLFNCKYVRLYIVERLDDQLHLNSTGFRSKRLCPNLSYYSGICLEWQNPTKNLWNDSRCPSRYLNLSSPNTCQKPCRLSQLARFLRCNAR